METEHIVKSYDQDLGQLDRLIAEMGGLAESQLAQAVDSLIRRDPDQAARVVEADQRIDDLEVEIDNFTIKLLALRQPMAEDLRSIIAGLKLASNLERIGDYSKNIAKRTITISQTPLLNGTGNTISRMSTMVQGMIKNVLDAYTSRDVKLAEDVRLRDEEVDTLYTSFFRELLTYMMEDPRNISPCTHLLFIAKNVERIGDHATAIAEQVHFMVEGEVPEDDRPKGDKSSFTAIDADGPGTGK